MPDPKITFGQFVALARSKGVKDDTEIDWVDFHGMDALRFTIYDGIRVTIAGMVNWDNFIDESDESDKT